MKNKICVLMLVLTLIIAGFSAPAVQAEASQQDYIYSYWGETVPSPSAYVAEDHIDGHQLGVGSFNAPMDLYVDQNNIVYLLDSGNNRIIVMNQDWKLIRIIDSFEKNGIKEQFNNPQGLFVAQDGAIYVADTENRRIVELSSTGSFIREIGAPESDVLRSGFEFYPLKIAVDKANRIYVVGRGVFDGLIEFDTDGKFSKFTGANRVKFDIVDYLWKRLSTQTQRESMEQFIPVEFSNLDLDSEGFIYTTTSGSNSSAPIKRLNPSGIDVLRREGYYEPQGDLQYSFSKNGGGSTFTDIDINDYGVYSVLDNKQGRIFSYSNDGDLLYVFGMLGKQKGSFKVPVAIARLGEQIMVLDRDLGQITVFAPTMFGQRVNEAVRYYYKGQEDQSAKAWEDVLRLNANYEIAYIGIGKSLLRQDQNKEAMKYFKLGMSRSYHSKAYERYRKEVMGEYFGPVMTSATLLILALFTYRAVRRRKKARHNADVQGTS